MSHDFHFFFFIPGRHLYLFFLFSLFIYLFILFLIMDSGQKQSLKNQNTPSGQKQKMMTLDFNRSLTFEAGKWKLKQRQRTFTNWKNSFFIKNIIVFSHWIVNKREGNIHWPERITNFVTDCNNIFINKLGILQQYFC